MLSIYLKYGGYFNWNEADTDYDGVIKPRMTTHLLEFLINLVTCYFDGEIIKF